MNTGASEGKAGSTSGINSVNHDRENNNCVRLRQGDHLLMINTVDATSGTCFPFRSTCVHPRFLVWFMLLHH
jgi:hypothetical protein